MSRPVLTLPLVLATLLAAAPSAAPSAATASPTPLAVDGPNGCAAIDRAADGTTRTDEDHMLFDFAELRAIEYFCEFQPPFDPAPADGEVQLRTGYCMEPGPFLYPGVFTLIDLGDGRLQLDSSDASDPTYLTLCPQG